MKTLFNLALSLLSILLLNGCGSSNDEATATPSKVGSLSVFLTDAPGDYQAVYVTIDKVLVHKAGDDEVILESDETNTTSDNDDVNTTEDTVKSSWIVVAEPNKTYDLLTLQNDITEQLGDTNLSVGKYTQMRLVLGSIDDNGTSIAQGYETHPYANYLVLIGGDVSELDVPSNTLKLNHNFEITADNSMKMIIDFDANKSIKEAGNSGKWVLTPVISVKTQMTIPEDGNNTEDANPDSGS